MEIAKTFIVESIEGFSSVIIKTVNEKVFIKHCEVD